MRSQEKKVGCIAERLRLSRRDTPWGSTPRLEVKDLPLTPGKYLTPEARFPHEVRYHGRFLSLRIFLLWAPAIGFRSLQPGFGSFVFCGLLVSPSDLLHLTPRRGGRGYGEV